MNKTANWALGLALIAIVIAIAGLNMPAASTSSTNTQQQVGGATGFDAIALRVPTAGTSSITGAGCVGGFATSTATPIIFTFGNQPTTTITGATPSAGVVAWQYGTCPTPPGL